MSRYSLFNKNILPILNDVCAGILISQVFDDLNQYELMEVIVKIAKFRDRFQSDTSEEVVAEMSKVIASEIVQELDDQFVNELMKHGTLLDLDFQTYREKSEFVYDCLGAVLKDALVLFDQYKESKDKCFTLASPMAISIMQSASKNLYTPAPEGSFKGPNNSMLVGDFDGIRVYSYLFVQQEVELILGHFDPASDEFDVQPVVIKNLSFL